MQLLRPLMLEVMLNEIQFKAEHIIWKDNVRPDALSRHQWTRFRKTFQMPTKNPHRSHADFYIYYRQYN